MNHVGDHFLARSRLAGDEDAGSGGRHPAHRAQRVLPGSRRSDDPAASPRFQLARQRLHRGLEPFRALTGFRGDPGLFGEALVREHEPDAVGETDRDLGVVQTVTRRLAVKEAEPSANLSREPHRDPDPGPKARGHDQALPLGIRHDLGLNVVDDLEVDPPQHFRLRELGGARRRLDVGVPRGRRDDDRIGSEIELGQAHQRVREDRLHSVGELLEHLAHVERLGERFEQDLHPVQAIPAPALHVPDPPVLDG